jgi:hypothetical protein
VFLVEWSYDIPDPAESLGDFEIFMSGFGFACKLKVKGRRSCHIRRLRP